MKIKALDSSLGGGYSIALLIKRRLFIMNMKMNQNHPPCEVREHTHLYKIGMFANMNRVTIKALRYYNGAKNRLL